MQQHFEQTICKTITAENEERHKLHITDNTSHILKCLLHIEVSTYPQNGNIVVTGILFEFPVIKSSCNIVNYSTNLVVSGPNSHSEIVIFHPKYGKKLKFALCVVLP